MKKYFFGFYIILFLLCHSTAFANEPLYFLCGPDEDGCIEGSEEYCACIPYNTREANKPYCLDFDDMRCKPLSEAKNCDTNFIYKDQGSCLATIFQSEPTPPCKITSESFCKTHKTYTCDEDGHPESCKPPAD